MTPLTRAGLKAYAARVRPTYETWLKRLVEIPTVSSDPARRDDVARGAAAAAELVASLGGRARVVKTGGTPARGRRVPGSEGCAHDHALQPPRRAAGRPRGRGMADRARSPSPSAADATAGRGTTDDKGPALAALFGVRRGAPGGRAGDGEAAVGDRGGDRLAALRRGAPQARPNGPPTDAVVISDGSWLTRKRPTVASRAARVQGLPLHPRDRRGGRPLRHRRRRRSATRWPS